MGPNWDSLIQFLNQRIELEAANYRGAVAAYRADRKRIDRDRADARDLIKWAQAWEVNVDDVRQMSTRLTWNISDGWQYCPGQYYPTEVCAAIAAAVSDAIVSAHRNAGWGLDKTRARAGRRLARWFR